MGRASRRKREALQRLAAERAAREQALLLPRDRPTAPRVPFLSFDAWRGLEGLAALSAERASLERSIEDSVAALVAAGVGWGDIGRALGLTRQGARQKYGDRLTGTDNNRCRLE